MVNLLNTISVLGITDLMVFKWKTLSFSKFNVENEFLIEYKILNTVLVIKKISYLNVFI